MADAENQNPDPENEEETGGEEQEETIEEIPTVPGSFAVRSSGLDDSAGSTSLWLITFTDIMALMLTFFVLLYTMSMPQEKEWSRMTKALNDEFSKYYAHAPALNSGSQDSINIDRVDFSRALDLNYLAVLLQETLKDKEAAEEIIVIKRKDRLIISMPNDLLFAAGKASVLSEGRQTLFTMGEALAKIRNSIEVIGHTDPRPVEKSGGRFESNWHLSLARAANVAGILQNTGYRRTISIKGMSSARYDELSEDMIKQERLSLSRRVDIVILRSTGSQRHGFQMGF